MLNLPPYTSIIDTAPFLIGLEEETQILHISFKKGMVKVFEEVKEALGTVAKITGNKKMAMLVDVTHCGETSRDIWTYFGEVLPGLVKAMAVVSFSSLGAMRANLFFTLTPQPYPVRIFSDENRAKEWLTGLLP